MYEYFVFVRLEETNEQELPSITREEAVFTKLLPPINLNMENDGGIIRIKELETSATRKVNRKSFIEEYDLLCKMVGDGSLKTFSFRRLQYLKAKFELHRLLNENKELHAINETPHRDFYNVRKVDTHIHAASSMNQKHLLRFMKKKMKTSGDVEVYRNKEGRVLTLKEVCEELNINAYDLTVDKLGVHAVNTKSFRNRQFNCRDRFCVRREVWYQNDSSQYLDNTE